jgi:hypothetical protein
MFFFSDRKKNDSSISEGEEKKFKKMRAFLIVVFAVFVTTIASSEIIKIHTPEDLVADEYKLAKFQISEIENDKKPLEQCTEKTKGVFSFYDYSVVIAMLAVSLKIGLFYGYFDKSSLSSADFMLGSKMGLFPVTLSLATSFVTAIELLGNPAEMFFYGTQFALIGKQKKTFLENCSN